MIFNKKHQTKARKLCFYLFVSLCATSLTHAAADDALQTKDARLSYKTIGCLNLSAVGLVKPDPLTITDFAPHEDKKDVCLEIHELTDRDKQEVVYNLFATKEGMSTADCPSITSLAKDLELFVGQGANTEKHVLAQIDHNVTAFGHAKLAHMLANPLSNINQLQKRQNLIKKLLEDQALFDEVEELLQQIRRTEDNFFSYWKTERATQEFLEKRLFFQRAGWREYNANPVAMEVYTRLCNVTTGLIILSPAVVRIIYKYIDGVYVSPWDHGNNMKESYTLYKAITETGHYIVSSFQPQTYYDFYNKMKTENLAKGASIEKAEKWAFTKTALETGQAALAGAVQAVATKLAIDGAKLTNKSIRFLHTQLNGVARMLECCKEFDKFVKAHTDFAQGLEHQEDFSVLCNLNDNSELAQLIQLLQTNTFNEDGSFFSHDGRVLAAHELMKRNKNQFTNTCLAIGEIDAVMSIAKLYKISQKQRVKFNFATFVENSKPTIELAEFWHPLVPADTVVTNNLSLGATGTSHNALITGSNTGGKSTTLKSILLNILFAQTLTIVPAQKAVVTPFTYLGCYLHIADDIGSGNSLFKAEVLRVQSFLEKVQQLEPSQFGFVVIDELFTGTAAETGAEAAYKVAEKLTEMNNIVFVLATHFPEMTELEKTTHGICKNYKVDAIKKPDGTIFRPFKLEQGVSSTSIANDILRTELDSINFKL